MSEPRWVLATYTVYKHPRDFPEHFVVRRWRITPGGGLVADERPMIIANTLEQARAALPHGLHCMPRQPDDDPAIYETWI